MSRSKSRATRKSSESSRGAVALTRAEGHELRNEVIALFLLALTAFFFLALYSEHVQIHRGTNNNICGKLGSQLAGLVLRYCGVVSSYFLVGVFAVWSLSAFFRSQIRGWGWKLIGSVLLVVSASTLEWHLTSEPLLAPDYMTRGGVYGEFFGGLFYDLAGPTGTAIVTGLLLLVGILLTTDLLISPVVFMLLRRGGSAAVQAGKRVPSLLEKTGKIAQKIKKARSSATPRVKPSKPRAVEELVEEDPAELEGDAPESEEDDEEYEYEYIEVDEDEPDDEEYEYEEDEDDEEYEYEESEEDDELHAESELEEEPEEEEEEEEEEQAVADEENRPERTIRLASESAPAEPTFTIDEQQLTFSGVYHFPPVHFLEDPQKVDHAEGRDELDRTAQKIEDTLDSFKIEAKVHSVQRGPVITQFEVSLAAGIKVHKIVSLSDDLAMALSARSVRVVAPIPGKSTVGIEVPNSKRELVALKDLLHSRVHKETNSAIPLLLGKDAAGDAMVEDLSKMPHLLIAGSTGSGKSVCINSIIASILMTKSPEDLKMILVDPKMVELSSFEEIPHLLTPVITDMKKAPAALDWLVRKMDQRYELLSKAGVRHIDDYNALSKKEQFERLTEKMSHEEADEAPEHLPYIVVIVDEFADLMMTAAKEVENSITRLAQKSRAVGIHVILATQRPSVNVITGLIKANLPTRISFMVASKVDSRTILDRNGAEKLLGQGNMLYVGPGTSEPTRAQSTYISDKEIRKIVKFLKKESQPQFSSEIEGFLASGGGRSDGGNGVVEDDLFPQAVTIVLESGRASTTLLQRRLSIGYTRASRLMDIMGDQGIVGPFRGSKPREIMISIDDWNSREDS